MGKLEYFLKTGKFLKSEIKNPVKKDNVYWQLNIEYSSNKMLEFCTTLADKETNEFKHVYDDFLEWFMCSNNPYFKMQCSDDCLNIIVRSGIVNIKVFKVIK